MLLSICASLSALLYRAAVGQENLSHVLGAGVRTTQAWVGRLKAFCLSVWYTRTWKFIMRVM